MPDSKLRKEIDNAIKKRSLKKKFEQIIKIVSYPAFKIWRDKNPSLYWEKTYSESSFNLINTERNLIAHQRSTTSKENAYSLCRIFIDFGAGLYQLLTVDSSDLVRP